MLKPVIGLLALLSIWFIIHLIVITIDGLNDNIRKVDVAVVLGNKVYQQGPSKRLQGRLNRAVELYKNNMFNKIIVSGGIEPGGLNEASIMKDYLVEQTIPEENIIIDENGYNTFLTAVNATKICEKHDLNSVLLISQFYHITRSKFAFKQVGFKEIYHGHAKYFELRDFYSLIREFFGFYKYLMM